MQPNNFNNINPHKSQHLQSPTETVRIFNNNAFLVMFAQCQIIQIFDDNYILMKNGK